MCAFGAEGGVAGVVVRWGEKKLATEAFIKYQTTPAAISVIKTKGTELG